VPYILRAMHGPDARISPPRDSSTCSCNLSSQQEFFSKYIIKKKEERRKKREKGYKYNN
jgi:hypothetical protein